MYIVGLFSGSHKFQIQSSKLTDSSINYNNSNVADSCTRKFILLCLDFAESKLSIYAYAALFSW